MQIVYPVLYAGGTVGGIWFIVRLMVKFQEDFTNRYALRLKQQEIDMQNQKIENDRLWRELGDARRETEACESRRAIQDIVIAQLKARIDRLDPEGTL